MRATSGCPGGESLTPRPPGGRLAADRRGDGLTRVVGLEDDEVADPLQDLADQPVARAVRDLDDNGTVVELLDHRPLLAQPAGALGRDPDPRDPGGRNLSVDEPLLLGEPVLDPLPRLELAVGDPRLLHPVEAEVTRVGAVEVVAAEIPALGPADQLIGLDLALGELVLVLLVVLELEHAPARDRLVHGSHDGGVVTARRDLEPLLGGVVAERGDDLLARGVEAGLRQVIAEEVDRGDQRLGLERQQPRRAGEVVAVGVGVDLDLLADDLRVEDVGASAEVDDVEHVEILAQLLDREVELVEHLLGRQRALLACRPDQHARERDEPREALGADHGLRGAAPVRARRAVSPSRPRSLGDRPAHGLGDAELVVVAGAQQLEPLGRLLRQLRGLEQARVVAPGEHPGDELARRGVVGLEDHPAALDAIGLDRLAEVPVGAVVALHQPGDPLADEDARPPLDRPHLPFGARGVIAAVEVLGSRKVVLGLGRVGDLALDPREAKDAHVVALVRVPDQVELAVAKDEVVGVHLAVGDLVSLQRVVRELDRLAA